MLCSGLHSTGACLASLLSSLPWVAFSEGVYFFLWGSTSISSLGDWLLFINRILALWSLSLRSSVLPFFRWFHCCWIRCGKLWWVIVSQALDNSWAPITFGDGWLFGHMSSVQELLDYCSPDVGRQFGVYNNLVYYLFGHRSESVFGESLRIVEEFV